MDKAVTYLLSEKESADCTDFYTVIGQQAELVKREAQERGIYEVIKYYKQYVIARNLEDERVADEYLLEYLLIGVFWREYIENARYLSYLFYWLFCMLYKLRKNGLKVCIDPIRGLGTEMLKRRPVTAKTQVSISDFDKLIKWLQATGDFSEEVERLKNWHEFFMQIPLERSLLYLQQAIEFAAWFQISAKDHLGKYTKNVAGFLLTQHVDYRFREDAIFCGRREVEYHLNMVGAEIMNQALRAEFLATQEKVVLLPQCMSRKFQNGCCAKKEGADFICVGCTADCNINLIRQRGMSKSFEIRIIPHSGDFSKALKKWSSQRNTGVVGVACVLNLLTGGYEMRKLRIPSQCVFLNYCGCGKHWSKISIPTNIDVNRLLQILSL